MKGTTVSVKGVAKDDLMVDARARDGAARMLRRAEQMHHPIGSLMEIYPTLHTADAYAVQCANVAQRVANGARVVGYKVGLSSPVMQQMISVNEPGFGHLLSDMSVKDGEAVAVSSLCRPRVEVEVAFVLRAALPRRDCTASDVLAATDYVAAAIEVIDSRIQDWQIDIIEFVADNACSARFALGRNRVRPADVDLTDLDAALYVGFGERDVLVTRGNTGAVLGNPVNAVVWLARTLAAVGVDLEPGQVLLSGSCIRAADVARGDHYRGCLTGLGEVNVEFV